jgi:predicted nucleic acid-binding protein
MAGPQIVLDTNVVVAALRSRLGASHRLLRLVGTGKFDINLTVPLFFEYRDACSRLVGEGPLTAQDVDDVLDYLCQAANRWSVFYLWRPYLPDPKDDMILEAAVVAQCKGIVTFNRRDFPGVASFGLRIWTPQEFLSEIGELP